MVPEINSSSLQTMLDWCWSKLEAGSGTAGCCFLEQGVWQSFFQLFAAFSDCWSSDREMECPHWLQLAQGEAWRSLHSASQSTEIWDPPVSTAATERPGLPDFSIIFLFQKLLFQQTLTWNLIPLNSFPGQNGAGASSLYGSQGLLGTFQTCREEIKSPVSEELGLREKF